MSVQNYGRINRFEKKEAAVEIGEGMKAIAAGNAVLRKLTTIPQDNPLREKLMEKLTENKQGLFLALTAEFKEKLGIRSDFNCDENYPIENLIAARLPLLSADDQDKFISSAAEIVQNRNLAASNTVKI